MALTKLTFYLTAITFTILIFVSISLVGTDLINTNRLNLNSNSLDYITEVKGINTQSGFTTISNTTGSESQQSNILDSEDDTQVSDTNDFLSTLFIKKERASQPTNYFKLAYNIPSNIIRGLGLQIADWTHLINILSYLLLISILVMVWTKLINT